MLHIVCILESFLTYGTWQNWVTQNCTQGFARPCTLSNLQLVNVACITSRLTHALNLALDLRAMDSIKGARITRKLTL